MTDKQIDGLWNTYANWHGDVKRMTVASFRAAVREAIAAEVSEAVELLRPFGEYIRHRDATFTAAGSQPLHDAHILVEYAGVAYVTIGTCRAAARFAAEFEKGRVQK